MHVRAALLHNAYLKKMDLENKYPLITNGDKIKFVYLAKPNPIKENVIGFMEELPKEFKLEKYIDYNLQFEKTFLDPMQTILDAAKWTAEEQLTLESFFA
jgi:DNA polymerase elongation subunit (family B)